MSKKYQITPYPLRLTTSTRKRLEECAKLKNRSLHAEIIDRLEKTLDVADIFVKYDFEDPKGLSLVALMAVQEQVNEITKVIDAVRKKISSS